MAIPRRHFGHHLRARKLRSLSYLYDKHRNTILTRAIMGQELTVRVWILTMRVFFKFRLSNCRNIRTI
jgi:hypothetical protein